MLTANTTPRFYAACLASYNNGELHGAWIDASTDTDEMQEGIAAMLRASPYPNVTVDCPDCDGKGRNPDRPCATCNDTHEVPSAEEHAIHDHEGLGALGEYDSLETIAEYMELIEEFDPIDADDLAAILADYQNPSEAADALRDNFAGIYDRFKDYSDEAADEAISNHTADGKAPQMLVNYFDYDAWERDLKIQVRWIDVPSGVAIFHP